MIQSDAAGILAIFFPKRRQEMILLHTSDWHLGRNGGDMPLLDDQRYFIDQICKIVKERGADAVLIAGDVFDRSVASAEAIRLYSRAMTELCFTCGVPMDVLETVRKSSSTIGIISHVQLLEGTLPRTGRTCV